MVQLKAQDLEHRNSMKGLRDQVRGSVSHHSALSISHNDDSFALGGHHVLGTGPEEMPTCSPGASVLKEDEGISRRMGDIRQMCCKGGGEEWVMSHRCAAMGRRRMGDVTQMC